MRNVNIISSIMVLAIILPNVPMFQTDHNMISDNPMDIAVNFLMNAPTYSFDGLEYSIEITKMDELESLPIQYVLTIDFTCLHSGYGDRSGKQLLQLLTEHTTIIKVVEGKIKSAIIDGVWDELYQKVLDLNSEDIKQIALEWLISSPTYKYDGIFESVYVLDIIQAQTFAPPSFWQVTIAFDSSHSGYGNREDEYLTQVITHHIIVIHVTEGAVDLAIMDNIWDELNQKYVSNIYTIENSENIAFEWLYSSPTFSFDGVKDSVRLIKTTTLRTPYTWEINIGFTCNYPGYGDRSGKTPLGMAQDHIIKIVVSKNMVFRAIIDNRWDELDQKMLE